MWRLWNKLFGWEYAMVEFGLHFYIERIHTIGGKKYTKPFNFFVLLEGSNYTMLTK